jgi:hypothetical protein
MRKGPGPREVDPMAKFSKAPTFDTSFNFGANVRPKHALGAGVGDVLWACLEPVAVLTPAPADGVQLEFRL